jgi:xylose dehydrogenase (NAD/NADP)
MTLPTRRLRWGVLGYARIARETLIPAILRSTNSGFYALASRDEARLAEGRARFPGLVKTHVGYEELLRDPAVEAVYIPLPNAQHCEWAIKAMEHGKHVLCEKPLALTAAEAGQMIAASTAHGVVLMEAVMYRYSARTQQVLEVLRSGVLGEIKFINASFRFLLANPASIKLKPELGGGALYDVGCYPVNFAGLVADTIEGGTATSWPVSVSAECVRTDGIDVICSALLKYPSGLMAALHCGFNAHKRVAAEITGTRGVLEVPDTFFGNAGSLVLTQDDVRQEIPVPESDRYRLEVEDFADAVLQGRAPQLGLDESLRNAGVIDQLLATMAAK